MKKFICMVLSILIFANMSISAFANNKTTDITTDELFLKYAQFLVKDEKTKNGLAEASNAYYKVVNSYSDSDETYAAYMNGMGDGISITIKDLLGKIGIGETLYETCARESATHYLQSMMKNENIVSDATSKISSAFKKIKTAYSVKSTVDKASIAQDLHKIAKENNISITPSDMDDLVDGLYGDKKISKYIKNADKAMDIWKVVVGVVELHALEKTTINMLMTELEKSGQNKSDLYLGLSLLKKNIEKDIAAYAIEKYCSEKALDFLVKKVDDFIFSFASGVTVAVVKVPTQFYANYIYKDAKGDKIAQAIMHTSFVSSIDICLSNYRIKFMKGNGTSSDIKTYKNLFNAYTSSYIATLEMCNNICKQKDKSTLGKECLNQIEKIKTTYTYDNHIKWSKELAKQHISAGTLNETPDETPDKTPSVPSVNTESKDTSSSIRFELESVPKGNLPYGESFSLKGWFRSDSPIVEARAYMLDSNKSIVMQSSPASSTTSNYKIQGYKLDKAMKFNELSPGGYYLRYFVRDANGDTATWTSDIFYIVKEKEPDSTLNINLTNFPSSIDNGTSVHLNGSVTSNYIIKEVKAVIFNSDDIGHYPTTIYPNSKSVNIANTDLSDGIYFEGLPGGTYTLEITAKDEKATKSITKRIKISERIVEEDDDSWLYTIDTPEKFEDLGYNPIVSNEEEYFEEEKTDGVKVRVNGKQIKFDQPPIIKDGRTLVPIRAVFEALNIDVEWNGDEQKVILTKGNNQIVLTIGSRFYTNGIYEFSLDVPPQIINGRTLLPIRAVAERFGCSVYWNDDTQTVVITSVQ